MNRTATTLMLRLVNILFVGVLLLTFSMIMGMSSIKDGSTTELIRLEGELGNSEDNLQLLNYLRTPISIDIDGDGFEDKTTISSLIEVYLVDNSDRLKEIISSSTNEILNNMEYCKIIRDNDYRRGYSIFLTDSLDKSPTDSNKVFSSNNYCKENNLNLCLNWRSNYQMIYGDFYVVLYASDSIYFDEEGCSEW
ncbi:hypothetical protein HOA59_01730 [archaeon]|jgi:hypothetical protein|nr:hypothetical protein [archaeon]MBT6824136.1 hypothetical protein [archaeon]MBT7107020.1 hypothetical protein [archaeon]MBT7297632.1 hypothetical protein [archaeon]